MPGIRPSWATWGLDMRANTTIMEATTATAMPISMPSTSVPKNATSRVTRSLRFTRAM